MKITAHKTFKNKFDQIRAGIKFIYRQNTFVIGHSVFRQTNKNISPSIRTCSFFHAAMQANVFSIEKTILFWREIHSFVPLSVFTIESAALILVITKDSGTIAHKSGSPLFLERSVKRQAH